MKLIILVQRHECLYNFQHKDYDNSLVKDKCWKEIVGELPCTVGEWQGSGRVAAWERHGMCELAFNVAGERHGMCESAFTVLHIICCSSPLCNPDDGHIDARNMLR
jgi:hypothetical protein